LGGLGGLTGFRRGVGLVAVWRRAIQSLRLRLRSGLRQSGTRLRRGGVYVGLRPTLVWGGPLALGLVVDVRGVRLVEMGGSGRAYPRDSPPCRARARVEDGAPPGHARCPPYHPNGPRTSVGGPAYPTIKPSAKMGHPAVVGARVNSRFPAGMTERKATAKKSNGNGKQRQRQHECGGYGVGWRLGAKDSQRRAAPR
jgi:hypothetical protein